MSSKNSLSNPKNQIVIRNATLKDAPAICDLSSRVYANTGMYGYSEGAITGQINHFPHGQFVIVIDDKVVGYCATFRISEELALKSHNWTEITGNGYASRHDPDGDWLYGMEVAVDPDYRGYRLGQRLYNERKRLCQNLGLKGIVFGGRLPTLTHRLKKFGSVEEYVEQVIQKKQRDPVLSFQLHNGFEVIGIIPHYLDADVQSLGYAVHLMWRNPKVPTEESTSNKKKYGGRVPDSIRIGSVQYMQRRVHSFEEFLSIVEYFVDVVADYKGDFVVFPELFALQLLSIEDQALSPMESMEALTKYTPQFKEALRDMSL
ncbi:MAG: GNAT family N-acetyltransferase, partial [Bacteroidota bacterium]